MSGPAGNNLKPGVDALQAWVKWTNDRGGVNGHLVTLIAVDDGGDPARHRAIVQELVERRGVIAFVHNTEVFTGSGSIDYIDAKRIPVIGSETANDYFNTNPNYFPQAPTGRGLYLGMLGGTASYALAQGKKRLGTLVCTEADVCRGLEKFFTEHATQFGVDPVYQGKMSLAQPDFTAECLAMRNARVEAVLLGMDENSTSRLAASCARQGVGILYGVNGGAASARLASDPNLDGAVVGSNLFPWVVGNTPGTSEFQNVMAQYLRVTPGVGHAAGWASAKLFEKAALSVTGAPSSQAIYEGLWRVNNDTLGGLTAPLTFAKDKPAVVGKCWFELTVKDGRWVPDRGPQAKCR